MTSDSQGRSTVIDAQLVNSPPRSPRRTSETLARVVLPPITTSPTRVPRLDSGPLNPLPNAACSVTVPLPSAGGQGAGQAVCESSVVGMAVTATPVYGSDLLHPMPGSANLDGMVVNVASRQSRHTLAPLQTANIEVSHRLFHPQPWATAPSSRAVPPADGGIAALANDNRTVGPGSDTYITEMKKGVVLGVPLPNSTRHSQDGDPLMLTSMRGSEDSSFSHRSTPVTMPASTPAYTQTSVSTITSTSIPELTTIIREPHASQYAAGPGPQPADGPAMRISGPLQHSLGHQAGIPHSRPGTGGVRTLLSLPSIPPLLAQRSSLTLVPITEPAGLGLNDHSPHRVSMSPRGRFRTSRPSMDTHDERLKLSLHVITFNMNSRTPSSLPCELLGLKGGDDRPAADIYVAGLQESGSVYEWERLLMQALGPGYVKLASESLQQIHIVLFVREALRGMLAPRVQTSVVATGIGNVLGNKGGVAVSVVVGCARLLFVSSHLAAHDDKVERRNADFHRIRTGLFRANITSSGTASPSRKVSSSSRSTQVSPVSDDSGTELPTAPGSASSAPAALQVTDSDDAPGVPPSRARWFWQRGGPQTDLWEACDLVVWLGDLNYRINGTLSAIQHLINFELWEVLRANDQLNIQRKRQKAFKGFEEGPLHFPPTFKLYPNTGEYNWKRIPSWTDRILWRINTKTNRCAVTLRSYSSVPQLKCSDHLPVMAALDVAIDTSSDQAGGMLPSMRYRCPIM